MGDILKFAALALILAIMAMAVASNRTPTGQTGWVQIDPPDGVAATCHMLVNNQGEAIGVYCTP